MQEIIREAVAVLSEHERQRLIFVAQRIFNYTELQGKSLNEIVAMVAEKMLVGALDQFEAIFGPCETPEESSEVRGGVR